MSSRLIEVPAFRVSSLNEPWSRSLVVQALEVHLKLGESASALVTLTLDGAEPDVIEIGRSVEVALGHGRELQQLFSGVIRAQTLQMPAKGAPTCVVEAMSASHIYVECANDIPRLRFGVDLVAVSGRREHTMLGRPSFRGAAKTFGNHTLHPDGLLELSGLGGSFDGLVRIETVSHYFDSNGWMTHIAFAEDQTVQEHRDTGFLP